jgi:3-methylcrotonyl-CoA carboxylase alpha subunit
MFHTLLIANRGEIAVRVIRACRALVVSPVAVYSDADRWAMHVRLADMSVRLGPPPAAESYLRADRVIEAARVSGAEAIHPGYGFLAENAAFAEQCVTAGLIFVGPSAEAMRLLGDKRAAKQLARRLGIPVVPGYDGQDQDVGTLSEAAGEIGFPLMIKAAAGGGGRGMRLVRTAEAFAPALEAAQREAGAAFGDPTILLERVILSPRHIEFQILADHHGTVLHLGERECSIQRKHQKVIEESPAAGLSALLRSEMGAAAVALGQAVGYRNAGTVEFLLAPTGEFYFLEVNTRLQVEHPVTELVTGIDLVREQLRIANGEPLTIRQEQIVSRGHAIECRLYAEDPTHDYVPSIGTLTRFAPPEGEGIRNDAGVETGDEITPYYDSMIAKLIVEAADRDACIDRTLAALRRYQIEGVITNLPELGAVLESSLFRAGTVATDFLDRLASTDDPTRRIPDLVLTAAACWRITALDLLPSDPWKSGPWRQAGEGIVLRFAADQSSESPTAINIPACPAGKDSWRIQLPSGERVVECRRAAMTLLIRDEGQVWTVNGEEVAGVLRLTINGERFEIPLFPSPRLDLTAQAGWGNEGVAALLAPMTGRLVKIAGQEGDTVTAGQIVAVIEAMKMEHAVTAPRDGILGRILGRLGDVVQAGALLAEMEE